MDRGGGGERGACVCVRQGESSGDGRGESGFCKAVIGVLI